MSIRKQDAGGDGVADDLLPPRVRDPEGIGEENELLLEGSALGTAARGSGGTLWSLEARCLSLKAPSNFLDLSGVFWKPSGSLNVTMGSWRRVSTSCFCVFERMWSFESMMMCKICLKKNLKVFNNNLPSLRLYSSLVEALLGPDRILRALERTYKTHNSFVGPSWKL